MVKKNVKYNDQQGKTKFTLWKFYNIWAITRLTYEARFILRQQIKRTGDTFLDVLRWIKTRKVSLVYLAKKDKYLKYKIRPKNTQF